MRNTNPITSSLPSAACAFTVTAKLTAIL